MPFTESAGGATGLHNVAMLDLLKYDPRPTFILDMTTTGSSRGVSTVPVYWNSVFAGIDGGDILSMLQNKTLAIIAAEARHANSRFRSWMVEHGETARSCSHRGYRWMKVMIASKWMVVFGTPVDIYTLANNGDLEGAVLSRKTSRTSAPMVDWTDQLPPTRISPHIAWARSLDWSQTALGPMSTWSSQLRSVANLVMQDPRPAVVFCGPELIMIYNEAYIELLGGFHPCLGVSARVALSSVWAEHFEPIIERNIAGETVEQTDIAIHMVRNDFMEETYFSLKFIPIVDSEGATIAHYEPLAETTSEVIARRQSTTLLDLSEEIPRARSTDLYWTLATKVLARNGKDIPFALLYSIEYDSNDSASSTARFSTVENQECTLRGAVGLPKDSPAGPALLQFNQDHGFTPYFRQATAARKPIMIPFDENPAVADMVQGIDWQGFGDPCRAVAICPLNPTSSKDNILGFVVIGLNPRRPYDSHYRQFILVASRLLSTSLTSIILHEEDIGRRERTIANAEALKRELLQQLSETQKEVERSVLKFQRFAERCDIGIFILDMNGVYSYRNDAWFSILDPPEQNIKLDAAWDTLIDDEFVSIGKVRFDALVQTKQHQSFELRLKRTWHGLAPGLTDSGPEQQPMWVICSIFPELTNDGEVLEIVGCITDISQQKWGEKLQATHASNAQESKRQLENFIDSTSHEMRNPLSAIVQCADSIISTHKAFENSKDYHRTYESTLLTTVDAAETIVQCSKHMKTIVDDVLTMSKLDSGLFVMTPVDVQVESIARNVVKMFEGEARAADIDLQFCIEDLCKEVDIATVSLDPTRVTQILINLVTNAIKFTRLEETRNIVVSLGIALEQPIHYAGGRIPFVRTSDAIEAPTLQADWVKGQPVYVIFSVTDTGRGLSDTEHDLLFARFSQASPRTHIDYGGSGLGLFISRRLTEMHGGAIGFASQAGVGSTFTFYIKSRRSTVSRRQSETNTAAAGLRIRQQVSTVPELPSKKQDKPLDVPVKNGIQASSLHVLVVEDNLVNQRVLAKQLRNLGMKVAVANHGGEALEHILTTTYCQKTDEASANELSLVLMDWEMPVMDGLTCVRRIRELQNEGMVKGHVPVIAVTANVRGEQVKIAMEAGMDDVISKPFRIPELFACIQKTLGRLT